MLSQIQNPQSEIPNRRHPFSFALASDTGMVYKLQGFPKCSMKFLEDGFNKKTVFRIESTDGKIRHWPAFHFGLL